MARYSTQSKRYVCVPRPHHPIEKETKSTASILQLTLQLDIDDEIRKERDGFGELIQRIQNSRRSNWNIEHYFEYVDYINLTFQAYLTSDVNLLRDTALNAISSSRWSWKLGGSLNKDLIDTHPSGIPVIDLYRNRYQCRSTKYRGSPLDHRPANTDQSLTDKGSIIAQGSDSPFMHLTSMCWLCP